MVVRSTRRFPFTFEAGQFVLQSVEFFGWYSYATEAGTVVGFDQSANAFVHFGGDVLRRDRFEVFEECAMSRTHTIKPDPVRIQPPEQLSQGWRAFEVFLRLA